MREKNNTTKHRCQTTNIQQKNLLEHIEFQRLFSAQLKYMSLPYFAKKCVYVSKMTNKMRFALKKIAKIKISVFEILKYFCDFATKKRVKIHARFLPLYVCFAP